MVRLLESSGEFSLEGYREQLGVPRLTLEGHGTSSAAEVLHQRRETQLGGRPCRQHWSRGRGLARRGRCPSWTEWAPGDRTRGSSRRSCTANDCDQGEGTAECAVYPADPRGRGHCC